MVKGTREHVKGNWRGWVALPGEDTIEKVHRVNKKGEEVTYEYKADIPLHYTGRWEWYKMPDNVYKPKEYPKCKCGRRYVPIKTSRGLTRNCYWCRRWKDNNK